MPCVDSSNLTEREYLPSQDLRVASGVRPFTWLEDAEGFVLEVVAGRAVSAGSAATANRVERAPSALGFEL